MIVDRFLRDMLREAVLSDFPGCFRLINTDFDYEPADILWRTSECGEHKSIYRIKQWLSMRTRQEDN